MLLAGFTAILSSAQVAEFEIADVHESPKSTLRNLNTKAQATTYEVRNATMADLIGIAWGGYPQNRIVGGPSWLEQDRFDVIGRIPPGTTAEARRLMFRPLLEQRFALKTHNDTRPLPFSVITAGKKIQMKAADGKGETGCKGGVTPDRAIRYVCRNITMAAFADGLRSMGGTWVENQPVLDKTGLEGSWDFDIGWTMPFFSFEMNQAESVTFPQALVKLGLRLEKMPVPTPVLVVDSVNRTPTPNLPGVAEAFPVILVPMEFDVANVKPSSPDPGPSRFTMPVGGRLDCERMSLEYLINRAFNVRSTEQVAGIPAWAQTARFDVEAKAPTVGLPASRLDSQTVAPMLRSVLKDRFKMTWHTEDRVVNAYVLKAGKPRLKKADPESRTWCRSTYNPPDAPMGSVRITCQNSTLAEIADALPATPEVLGWPVLDATGLKGGWDVSLTFLQNAQLVMAMNRAGNGNGADAADPVNALTILEAVEKQTGLKPEAQKRTERVIVIDHIEQLPTEN